MLADHQRYTGLGLWEVTPLNLYKACVVLTLAAGYAEPFPCFTIEQNIAYGVPRHPRAFPNHGMGELNCLPFVHQQEHYREVVPSKSSGFCCFDEIFYSLHWLDHHAFFDLLDLQRFPFRFPLRLLVADINN